MAIGTIEKQAPRRYAGPMASVLVVDDDEVVRDVVVRYLDREGFESRQAADGEAARRAISEQVPTSSSWTSCCRDERLDVCRWVRSVSQVPIILLTARGESPTESSPRARGR